MNDKEYLQKALSQTFGFTKGGGIYDVAPTQHKLKVLIRVLKRIDRELTAHLHNDQYVSRFNNTEGAS